MQEVDVLEAHDVETRTSAARRVFVTYTRSALAVQCDLVCGHPTTVKSRAMLKIEHPALFRGQRARTVTLNRVAGTLCEQECIQAFHRGIKYRSSCDFVFSLPVLVLECATGMADLLCHNTYHLK